MDMMDVLVGRTVDLWRKNSIASSLAVLSSTLRIQITVRFFLVVEAAPSRQDFFEDVPRPPLGSFLTPRPRHIPPSAAAFSQPLDDLVHLLLPQVKSSPQMEPLWPFLLFHIH
jgi:hypothetical protein